MPNESPEQSPRPVLLRRVVLFGVPALYVCLGLLHPTENPGLGDPTAWFIGLHVAQLFLIAGLGYALWLLLEDRRDGAVRLARTLVLPFVVLYTALDAILGIALGGGGREGQRGAGGGPGGSRCPGRQPGRGHAPRLRPLLRRRPGVAGRCARRRRGTVRGGAVAGDRADGAGSAIFALGHAPPTGPIGMGMFVAGEGVGVCSDLESSDGAFRLVIAAEGGAAWPGGDPRAGSDRGLSHDGGGVRDGRRP